MDTKCLKNLLAIACSASMEKVSMPKVCSSSESRVSPPDFLLFTEEEEDEEEEDVVEREERWR